MFRQLFRLRKFVGKDLNGNKYFIDHEKKRIIEYKNGLEDFDKEIPIQWLSWLRYNRDDVPNEEEIEKFNEERKIYFEKVKEIERRDRKEKLKSDLNFSERRNDEKWLN